MLNILIFIIIFNRLSNKLMTTNRYSSILIIPDYFYDYINFKDYEYIINYND